MREVVLFTFLPRRLRRLIGIGKSIDNDGDSFAEAAPNLLARICSPRIFDGIVQQRGDGFIFRAAVFYDDGRNGEQVADVRDRRAFAGLSRMQLVSLDKRLVEARREIGTGRINALGHG